MQGANQRVEGARQKQPREIDPPSSTDSVDSDSQACFSSIGVAGIVAG